MKQENISSQWNHLSSQVYLWYLPLGSICTDHFVLTSLKPPPQVLMLDPSNSSNHCFLYLSFGDRDPPRSMQHGTSSSGEDIFGWKPGSNSPGSHPEKNYYGTRQLPFRIIKHIVYHIVSQLFTKQSTCIPIEWFLSNGSAVPHVRKSPYKTAMPRRPARRLPGNMGTAANRATGDDRQVTSDRPEGMAAQMMFSQWGFKQTCGFLKDLSGDH